MSSISKIIKKRQDSQRDRGHLNSSTRTSQSTAGNRGLKQANKQKSCNQRIRQSTVANRGLNKSHSRTEQKQLELRDFSKPAISAKLAPGSHHRSKCDRYWLCCNYVDKPFGGLYYRAEIDYILAHFRGRTGLIEPREFGIVAERAILAGRAA